MKNDKDAFLVKLNGMPVIVRLLRTNILKASVKDGLMLHQKISTCPFVHQLFGIGHAKQHGWFAALEFVERLSRAGTLFSPAAAYAPWQKGKVERKVRSFKEATQKAEISP